MYISPIDILDISLDELINIDEKKIIRLEKRLKILKLQKQESFYNQEEMYSLINQLKDVENRKVIIFIEKHPSFKEFITSGNDNGPKTFSFEKIEMVNTDILSSFLAPYLETYFIPLVKKDYQKKKYDTIIEALKAKEIFSSDILLKCYTYIEQQTNILNEIIKVTPAKRLYEKQPQVTYPSHIDLLNSVPIGIIESAKIGYINALVHYYNKSQTNNTEYPKIKKAYALFSKITVDDPDLEKQLKQLSRLGYEQNINEEASSNDSDSSNIFRVIAFIIIVVITVLKLTNRRTPTNYNNYNNKNNILKWASEMQKKEVLSSQNLFIKQLYNKTKEADEKFSDTKKLTIVTGSNPYTNFIKRIPSSISQLNIKNKDSILIENNSDKSLILFTKNIGDFKSSVFINKKDTLRVAYPKKGAFIFYLGKNFSEVSYENRTEKIFTDVKPKDSELLLQKHILYRGTNNKNRKIVIEKDTILFIKTKTKRAKNYGVIKALVPVIKNKNNITSNYNPSIPENVNWAKSKNTFFNDLKNKSFSKKTKRLVYEIPNGENPYPVYFKSYKNEDISGYPVLIKNNTKKHLILFNRNLPNDRDFATYITPNGELTIYLHEEGDSLYFNMGKHFYPHKNIEVLKMNANDKNIFNKPIIVNGSFIDNPRIIVNEKGIESFLTEN